MPEVDVQFVNRHQSRLIRRGIEESCVLVGDRCPMQLHEMITPRDTVKPNDSETNRRVCVPLRRKMKGVTRRPDGVTLKPQLKDLALTVRSLSGILAR